MTVALTLAARPNSQAQSSNQNAPQTAPQTAPRTTNGGAWLGVSGITLTPDVAQAMNLANDQTGALLEEVTSGSPAEKAGLQGSSKSFDSNGQQIMIGGDVVTAVDGKAVTSMQDLSAAIKAQKPGDKVELTVLRDGKEITVAVTLGARSGSQNAPSGQNGQQPSQPQTTPRTTNGGAWLGVSGITLTPDVAQAMNLANDQTGALLEEVTSGSPAEKAGLQGSSKSFDSNGQQIMIGGDVVTAVDGNAVASMQDLSAAIKAKQAGDKVELTVLRDGKEIAVAVTLGARSGSQNAPSGRNGQQPTQPTQPQQPQQPQTANSGAWLGISGLTVTPEIATR